MSNKKVILVSTCLASVMLGGCANKNLSSQINDVYNKTENKVNSSLTSKKKEKPKKFIVSDKQYTHFSYKNMLPSWETKRVEIHAYQQPLVKIMNILFPNNEINISYDSGMANKLVNINYCGNIIGALKYLMNKNNIYFQLSGTNQILWTATESKVFNIAYLPGSTQFSVGGSAQSLKAGTDSNSSSSTNDNSASLKGKLSVWKDIESSVHHLLSKSGTMTTDQSSGTITVIDKPLNVKRIGRIINQYNTTLSKRVRIKIKVLEVQLNKQHQYGIDWSLVYKGMTLGSIDQNTLDTVSSFSVDTQGATGDSAGDWKNTNAMINALDGQGKTSMIDEPTITSLNNSPNTFSVTDSLAYIKSSQSTSTYENGSHTLSYSVTPDNVITGLRMTLIPHIQGNKVYLSIDGNLSVLKNLTTKEFGATSKDGNTYELQLPDVTSKSFNQRVMVKNNNLLVLSGLRTVDGKINTTKNFGIEALGQNGENLSTKELVVLIQPTIVG